MNEILDLLAIARGFFAYFLAGLVFLGAYIMVYMATTKCDDLLLIRHGNTAAASSLVGSAVGFSLPLAAAILHTASAQGFVFWTLVAMVTQIATYFFLKLVLKDVDSQIEANNPAYGILAGGISIVVGIINAACVA
jgi:putative membrane protein